MDAWTSHVTIQNTVYVETVPMRWIDESTVGSNVLMWPEVPKPEYSRLFASYEVAPNDSIKFYKISKIYLKNATAAECDVVARRKIRSAVSTEVDTTDAESVAVSKPTASNTMASKPTVVLAMGPGYEQEMLAIIFSLHFLKIYLHIY